MPKASPICFKRQLQLILRDFALASERTQTARVVNTTPTAIIATNSIRVIAERRRRWWNGLIFVKESPTGWLPRRSRATPFADSQSPTFVRFHHQREGYLCIGENLVPNQWHPSASTPKNRPSEADWWLNSDRPTGSIWRWFHLR